MVSAAIAPFIRKVFHSVLRSLRPDSIRGWRSGSHGETASEQATLRPRIGLLAASAGPKNLDGLPHSPYTTAVPGNGRDFGPPRAPRDALAYGGDGRGFCNVPALRTDGQGPPGGPQGEPLEHQDQAALPAQPGQRHLHLGRARPQRAPARLDQCGQERRPQWRPRQVPAEGQGRRALPPRAGSEARDREEGRQARIRQEGELSQA